MMQQMIAPRVMNRRMQFASCFSVIPGLKKRLMKSTVITVEGPIRNPPKDDSSAATNAANKIAMNQDGSRLISICVVTSLLSNSAN